MSYNILPNIIFIFSILGVLLIILRHLPEAAAFTERQTQEPAAEQRLQQKGLPAQAISTLRVGLGFAVKKTWHFILEAKDLRPQAALGYKVKKLFGSKPNPSPGAQAKPLLLSEVKDEKYYLDLIKLQPKNLANYDLLGKFYLEQENLQDAKDLYLYLTNHEPASPEHQARLAYCYYRSKNFKKAAEHYQKSISLDSTQPNRYYNLSLALKSSGQRKQAFEAIQKALELEPENPKYREILKQIEKV